MAWVSLVARLVLGGVWVAAGYLKIADPAENVRAVRAYDLLPEAIVPAVGHALPVLELAIGLCLLLGLLVRVNAAISAALLTAFVIGIASAWARGMSIECGCFGGGGGPAEGASEDYPWELARDAGLLLLSLLLVWRPGQKLALDTWLVPAPPPEVVTGEPGGTGRRAERARQSQRAAQVRREAERRERRRRNRVVSIVGAAALAMVVVIGGAVQAARDTTGAAASVPDGVVDGYALPYGDADAEVVVDVYEDFLCPFCAQLEQASAQPLEELVGDGEVQVRYHVLAFLDRASTTDYSTRAANALAVVLDESGPEVAKEFHDALFAAQPPEGGPGLSDDQLVQIAADAGAEGEEVSDGIKSMRFGQWVRNATDAASRAGISQTPTVRVDGEDVEGAQSMAELVELLEQRVREASDS